jgi:hypothetical protein
MRRSARKSKLDEMDLEKRLNPSRPALDIRLSDEWPVAMAKTKILADR